MNYDELRQRLTDSCLFSDDEVSSIVATCGKATLGNAVIACKLLGIELSGDDVDDLFAEDD